MVLIFKTVGSIIFLLAIILAYKLEPKVEEWLQEKTKKSTQERVYALVNGFVKAAEQMFRDTDDDGSIRLDYVIDELNRYGIKLTGEIEAYIESCVFDINHMKLESYYDDDWTDKV